MRTVLNAAEDFVDFGGQDVRVWLADQKEMRAGERETMECAPCMLMNCPSFSAAPRILESLDTKRVIFASVIMTDCVLSTSDVVERRKSSEAAPYESDAARPITTLLANIEAKGVVIMNDEGRKTHHHSEIAGRVWTKGPWMTGGCVRRLAGGLRMPLGLFVDAS